MGAMDMGVVTCPDANATREIEERSFVHRTS